MQTFPPAHQRELKTQTLHCDLAVIGGGMAGTCCAITAARAGLKVVLVQDRPVLGGNGSSEVRLWTLGATAHMSNNNRWAREGGVIDEILVENMWRNPEGNALVFDTVLLEKVIAEPNITLLLNTAMLDCKKRDADQIESVRAFCSQNSTMYQIHAPLFCDASGDGVLGFLSGAAFRIGAESRDEFDEGFAPAEEYGELLGHSIYFYSKDTGHPVEFVPPAFALANVPEKIPRFRRFSTGEYGCRLWWIEFGGRLDTVHETETIKWELWKVVYGVWDYIKNSGEFPDAKNLTLEWVGHIPGKRESRRFEGDYMLNQKDLIEQREHYDAVAFGGWSLDLHPADGVFSEKPGCTQWHSRGIYQIPYRSLYSHNIHNLFLAGRVISSSHVAFASSRVMGTLAHAAQAVGIAAFLCYEHQLQPRDLSERERISRLQNEILKTGQHVPHLRLRDHEDLARNAQISASSELHLSQLKADGNTVSLQQSRAQLLPLPAGRVPQVCFAVEASENTTLELQLRISSRRGNFTPDRVLASQSVELKTGTQQVATNFDVTLDEPCYAFFCLMQNDKVRVCTSAQRLTGVLSVTNKYNQQPPSDIGVDAFEFWQPDRRPAGKNFALEISPPLEIFGAQNVCNGLQRPTMQPNAWLTDWNDTNPTLTLRWDETQNISRLELFFDPDYDHPMESVLMGHPERAMPFCAKHYRVLNSNEVVYENRDNHQARNTIILPDKISTNELRVEILSSHGVVPAAIFEVRCYA
jgi:hypothetical protein